MLQHSFRSIIVSLCIVLSVTTNDVQGVGSFSSNQLLFQSGTGWEMHTEPDPNGGENLNFVKAMSKIELADGKILDDLITTVVSTIEDSFIGSVHAFVYSNPPQFTSEKGGGWLLCDGASYLAKDYPKLASRFYQSSGGGNGAFAMGGTVTSMPTGPVDGIYTFDASSTFQVPNLVHAFIRGLDKDKRGVSRVDDYADPDSRSIGSLQTFAVQDHLHNHTMANNGAHDHAVQNDSHTHFLRKQGTTYGLIYHYLQEASGNIRGSAVGGTFTYRLDPLTIEPSKLSDHTPLGDTTSGFSLNSGQAFSMNGSGSGPSDLRPLHTQVVYYVKY